MSTPVDVVIDTGTDTIKFGIAGDISSNKWFMPTRVRGRVSPLANGVIHDWDAITGLWKKAFDELGVSPTNCRVLMVTKTYVPKFQRESIVRALFERLNVQACYLANSSVLALAAASGKTTGLVVDSGESELLVDAVVNGAATAKVPAYVNSYGGDEIEAVLSELVRERASAEQDLRPVKESICYVASDYATELDKKESATHTFPDGQRLELGYQRFHALEVLFQPDIVGDEGSRGLPKLVADCILNHDPGQQAALYSSIVLCGGNTLFPGLQERLTKELRALAPANMKPTIISLPERQSLAWRGGSSLAKFGNVKWITAKEFATEGAAIVHTRCV